MEKMVDSDLCKDVAEIGQKINKYSRKSDDEKLLKYLGELDAFAVDAATLKKTEIGIIVNKLRKMSTDKRVKDLAKSLVKKWKKMVTDAKNPSKKIQNKGAANLQEDASCSHQEINSKTDDPIRQKSRKLLAESLASKGVSNNINRLATRIECHVFEEFQCSDSRYKNRIRSRIVNLRDVKNPKLKENILKGVITPEQFARMTPDEMASEEVKKMKEEMLKQSILDAQVPKTNLSSSDLFKCSKCGERDTTYNQVQTLSGDEPMTTFVVCNKCGKRWKFN